MTLPELIARLESASKATLELRDEIALAIGWTKIDRPGFKWVSLDGNRWTCPPNYPVRLDAAITLIPPDLYWLIGKGKTRPDEPSYGAAVFRPGEDEPIARSEHATSLELCICAVALRAIAGEG